MVCVVYVCGLCICVVLCGMCVYCVIFLHVVFVCVWCVHVGGAYGVCAHVYDEWYVWWYVICMFVVCECDMYMCSMCVVL